MQQKLITLSIIAPVLDKGDWGFRTHVEMEELFKNGWTITHISSIMEPTTRIMHITVSLEK